MNTYVRTSVWPAFRAVVPVARALEVFVQQLILRVDVQDEDSCGDEAHHALYAEECSVGHRTIMVTMAKP